MRTPVNIAAILLACVSSPALTASPSDQPVVRNALEAAFDADIRSADQMAWLREMASAPNHLGSAHNKSNAEMQLALFRAWGWDVHIEIFQALYPTPVSTVVELVAPDRIPLGGQEPPIAGDASTSDLSGALPPYVAFQGDGDVTADIVYVNYGMPEDYRLLAQAGIDVKGKIVIARYGSGVRGLKPKLAQDHGAVGCIIYSDPADDGYARGDVYPKGGWRPEASVQRGSVTNLPLYAGDPLTPGVGSTSGAKRIARADAPVILKIPTLPMSYGDAGKILARLGGRMAPAEWRGALAIPYHIGGDNVVKLHLAVRSEWKQTPVYDVIAKIKGARYPDQWVIRGNHRDAWVFGAADPLSGQVALMSEAKAMGALLKRGWRPARTIVYASWDGEEASLFGSTEWVEAHQTELRRKAVLYVNTDSPGRGILDVAGNHDFQHMVNQAADTVADPETGVSLLQRQRAAALMTGTPAASAAAEKKGDMPIGPLGSGSDYTAFAHFLGVPALNVGYIGEGENRGVYHSAYDTYHHYTTFDDPGLRYGATLSKFVGRLVLRAANAETPPMRFGDFADTAGIYVQEVKQLQQTRRDQDKRLRTLIDADAYRLAADPARPLATPSPEAAAPQLDFAPLEAASRELRANADRFDAVYAARGTTLASSTRNRLNLLLRDIDQLLLDPRGLPGRPWYRNMISAPGLFTGYGAKTLPGIREAIEERRFDDARIYIGRTAKVLGDYAARLDQARAVMEERSSRSTVAAPRSAHLRASVPSARDPGRLPSARS